MCDSMRLSATGRPTSECFATARWTCAIPPTPSCSYTMYGPNSSVGEPSLTPEAYQGSRSLRLQRRLRMRMVTGHPDRPSPSGRSLSSDRPSVRSVPRVAGACERDDGAVDEEQGRHGDRELHGGRDP